MYDVGEDDGGRPFFVMELIDGISLADRIASHGALSREEALRVARDLASGLSAAHALGVVHRDVKPDNVLLTRGPGGQPRTVLVDFGIAQVRRDQEPRITTAGMLVGTPEYMAPEQVNGLESDARTDIWGLGATLYEMLAGRSPFHDDDIGQIFRKILLETPDRPSSVDDRLWAILSTALEKDAARRFAAMPELLSELSDALELRRDPEPRWRTAATLAPPPAVVEEAEGPEASLDAAIRARLGDA